MRKVKLEIIRPWITKTLIELSGSSEDDVLIEYAMSLLEDTSQSVCSSLSLSESCILMDSLCRFLILVKFKFKCRVSSLQKHQRLWQTYGSF